MRSVLVIITAIVVTATHAEGQGTTQRPGMELIGARAREWTVGPEWANSKPMRLQDLRGRVVVVRFWTDTCPYCAASLPAMQTLADELRAEPVTFVGIYHSKPRGSEKPWREAVARANELGVTFPIAYDHLWRTVRAWWLNGRQGVATSATFVIDPKGKFVLVHPGPAFYSSDDPKDKEVNADYQAIRAAIRAALPAERNGRSSTKAAGPQHPEAVR